MQQIKRTLCIFMILSFTVSCSRSISLTDYARQSYAIKGYPYMSNNRVNSISNIHRGEHKVQMYTSSKIFLWNKQHGTIIIPANTKCIFDGYGPNKEIRVRFQTGDQKYLSFKKKGGHIRDRYYLVADWRASGGPKLNYGGVTYKVDMLRSAPRTCHLRVRMKKYGFIFSGKNNTPQMGRIIYAQTRQQQEYTNNIAQNKVSNDSRNSKQSELPPVLSITDITLSKSVLNAEEKAKLSIGIKNIGPGKARDVYVKLNGNISGLNFPSKSYFPTIPENGGTRKIEIDIQGDINLPTAQARIQIEIIEPNFKVKVPGKQLKFETKEFRKPELILATYNIIESLSANPNKQIDLNEIIDLKFAVQNVGQGNAENVKISSINNQKGVRFLGVVNGDDLKEDMPNFQKISTGKYETITYRYFVNSEFTDSQLEFTISSRERLGKYGFSERKSFPINKRLEESGYIRTIASNNTINPGKVIIEDIPDFVSDVDVDIPSTSSKQAHTYALIIGNEDYSTYQTDLSSEVNVDYAINDAQVFKTYCTKTLGIPDKQIRLLTNATYGQMSQSIEWIKNLADVEGGQAKLIFYYSGHGLPDEQTKQGYLIPVDVSGNNVENGISLKKVYQSLNEFPADRVTVFLDACFSGGARNEALVAMKGLKIRPKEEDVSGNMVVFSSSSGNESSAVYREKQHGYFTYFLLKKLQESKGDVDYKTLDTYLNYQVKKATGLSGKIQNPQCQFSSEVEKQWENWKLK